MIRHIRIMVAVLVLLLYAYLIRMDLDPRLYGGIVPLGLFAMEVVEKTAHYILYRKKAGKVLDQFDHKSIFASKGMSILLAVLALWIMLIGIYDIYDDFVYLGGIALFALSLINIAMAFTKGKVCENGIYVKGYYAPYKDISVDFDRTRDMELNLHVLPISSYRVQLSEEDQHILDFLKERESR